MIASASWRLDGFVSLDADAVDDWVQPPAINAAGRKLPVNENAADGTLTVAAALEDGQPVQGYAAADCVPLRADEVRHVVRRGERDRSPFRAPDLPEVSAAGHPVLQASIYKTDPGAAFRRGILRSSDACSPT